jgi:uncharacterized membrane protein YeiH
MVGNLEITVHQVPLVLEVIATLAWALSGSLVARSKGFDFAGVFTVALVATTGGGLIRDGIFLQRIPVMVTNPLYMALAFCAAIVISLFGGLWERIAWADESIGVIDAIGTPSYALIGFQLSYLAGVSFWGSLLIGLVNGVAGGILRDVLVGHEVQLLRPGQYVSIILLGALVLYAGLIAGARVDSEPAAWIAILLAATARILVIRYNWRSGPVNQWALDQTLSQLPGHIARGRQSAVTDQERSGSSAQSDK